MRNNIVCLEEPVELFNKLEEYELKGKTISSFEFNGHIFDYNSSIFKFKSDGQSTETSRFAEIDQPIVINFSDGTKFYIEYNEGSVVYLGLNDFSFDKDDTIPEVDLNVLFSNCNGHKIIAYKIYYLDSDSYFKTGNFTGGFSKNERPQEKFIDKLMFILDDGNSIVFENDFDYGLIYIEDSSENLCKISFEELEKGLNVDENYQDSMVTLEELINKKDT